MARVVEDFEFKGKHENAKYPWSLWLDGRVWELTVGEDFPMDIVSFRNFTYMTARRMGLKVHTKLSDDRRTFKLQAYKPETSKPLGDSADEAPAGY